MGSFSFINMLIWYPLSEGVIAAPSTLLACSSPRCLSHCGAVLGLGCCFWSWTPAIVNLSSDWEVLHSLGMMEPHGFYGMTLKPCWNLIKDRDWALFWFLKRSASGTTWMWPCIPRISCMNCMDTMQFCFLSFKQSVGLLAKEFLLAVLSDDAQCWANASAAVVWHVFPLEVPRPRGVVGTFQEAEDLDGNHEL